MQLYIYLNSVFTSRKCRMHCLERYFFTESSLSCSSHSFLQIVYASRKLYHACHCRVRVVSVTLPEHTFLDPYIVCVTFVEEGGKAVGIGMYGGQI